MSFRSLPLIVLTLLSFTGCAAFSSSSSDPTTAASSEDPAATMEVDDKVPDVGQCHTDNQVCALEAPLQPGLGCFCKTEDGSNEPGFAGD